MEDLSASSKSEVRARMKAAGVLSAEGARAASLAIERGVEGLSEFTAARTILAFLPIAGEPDVRGLLGRALLVGRRVALPSVDWKSKRMEAVEVRDLDADVVETRHGVREPRAGLAVIPIDEIDVVLVPGVAFDVSGVRLGRGGGFYDRFLERPGLRAARVGVAFERQVVGRLPREGHDAAVGVVVTEGRVIRV